VPARELVKSLHVCASLYACAGTWARTSTRTCVSQYTCTVVGFCGHFRNHLIGTIVVPSRTYLVLLTSLHHQHHQFTIAVIKLLASQLVIYSCIEEDRFTDVYRAFFTYVFGFCLCSCHQLHSLRLHADLLHCPDDRALRQHIHLIPPQYRPACSC
jgi:hypothetical protein